MCLRNTMKCSYSLMDLKIRIFWNLWASGVVFTRVMLIFLFLRIFKLQHLVGGKRSISICFLQHTHTPPGLFWHHSVSGYIFSISKQFNDALKTFHDFKSNKKNLWSNAFWYLRLCIFWKFIQYKVHSKRLFNFYGVDVLYRPASHPIFSYWVD